MRSSEEFRNPRKESFTVVDPKTQGDLRRETASRPVESVESVPEMDRPLIERGFVRDIQDRWNAIQASFIDQPEKAVDDANRVIEELMTHLTNTLANDRRSEDAESAGASTENMRLALQRRRTIFNRLISM